MSNPNLIPDSPEERASMFNDLGRAILIGAFQREQAMADGPHPMFVGKPLDYLELRVARNTYYDDRVVMSDSVVQERLTVTSDPNMPKLNDLIITPETDPCILPPGSVISAYESTDSDGDTTDYNPSGGSADTLAISGLGMAWDILDYVSSDMYDISPSERRRIDFVADRSIQQFVPNHYWSFRIDPWLPLNGHEKSTFLAYYYAQMREANNKAGREIALMRELKYTDTELAPLICKQHAFRDAAKRTLEVLGIDH